MFGNPFYAVLSEADIKMLEECGRLGIHYTEYDPADDEDDE